MRAGGQHFDVVLGGAAAQSTIDHVADGFNRERFAEIGECALADGEYDALGSAGDGHHHNFGFGPDFVDALEQRHAVEPRHVHVGHDQVIGDGFDAVQAGESIISALDLAAWSGESRSEQVVHVGIVVDNQDALSAHVM